MAHLPERRGQQGGAMTRRGEQKPLDLFRREMDSLFSRFFGNEWFAPSAQMGQRFWDFDVRESDKEIVVRAELPGFDEKEVNVELVNDVLTIRAEKQQKGEQEEEYRSYFRSVTLPPGTNPEQAQATYRNGVLELHLQRPEGSRGKRIPIQGQQRGTGQPALTSQAKGSGSEGGHQASGRKAKS
jgi:HSP20 family protein